MQWVLPASGTCNLKVVVDASNGLTDSFAACPDCMVHVPPCSYVWDAYVDRLITAST